MGSQSIEILRQGIWASLTGGWYYDPHQNVFCNTFHLYLWLYLVCSPFCVYLYSSWSLVGWLAHLVVLFFVASLIKITNYVLHHIFDTGECLEEEIIPQTPPSDPFRPASTSQNVSSGHQRASSFEAMEMQVVNTQEIENMTPPIGCSSRNSIMETSNAPKSSGVIDLKVDVHHKDSSESEEGGLKERDEEHVATDFQMSSSESTLKNTDVSSPSIEIIHSPDRTSDYNEIKFAGPNSFNDQTTDHTNSVVIENSLSLNDTSNYEYVNESADIKKVGTRSLDSRHPCPKFNSKRIPIGSQSSHDVLRSTASGERSSSAPNCLEEAINEPVGVNQIDFNNQNPSGKTSRVNRRGKTGGRPNHRNKSEENVRSAKETAISDPDTEEELTSAKSSASPLLNERKREKGSSRKGKSNVRPLSKVYQPLVCRATSVAKASSSSSFINDNVKVTTLTFENIYADSEASSDTVKLSSSSEEVIGQSLDKFSEDGYYPPCESLNRDKIVSLDSNDSSECLRNMLSKSVGSDGIGELDSQVNKVHDEDDNLSELSNSSCPDIDWLFYHSESDSEFTNVVKKPTTDSSAKKTSDDEDDSWNVVRSSPECNSESAEEPKPTMREHENSSKQGAIPKQRRQGVIVSDGDDMSQVGTDGREAAGVTMDLVRKMLDVFSSYPENRPRDIKKLLVLVSLEQDRRGGSHDEAEVNKNSYSAPEIDEASSTVSRSDTDHNISSLCGGSSKDESSRSSSLHRKPAVRRRRMPVDGVVAVASTSNSPVGDSQEYSRNEQQALNFGSDYQTTFSGAVSYFGKSDKSCENENLEAQKGRKNSSEDPLSAFTSSSVHLATCHDDTSNGAVHCFQDERGHWFTYTFNNSGVNMTSAIMPLSDSHCLQRSLQRTFDLQESRRNNQQQESGNTPAAAALAREDVSLSSSSMSLCSGLTVVLDNQGATSPSSAPWPDNLKISKERQSSQSTSPVGATQRRTSPPSNSSLVPHLRGEEGRRGVRALMDRHIQRRRVLSSSSTSAGMSRNPRDVPMLSTGSHHLHLLNLGTPGNPLQLFTSAIFDRRRLSHRMHPSVSNTNDSFSPGFSGIDGNMDLFKQLKFTTPVPQTVQYYRIKLYRNKTVKIKFDRLSLLSLLDRNLTILESLLNILLIVAVGFLGCIVLFKGFYQEFNVFIFCVVVASCQYSLFKSVQPDAASPTHGYNHIILYSRPVYFILCCSILLTVDFYLEYGTRLPSFYLYGIELTSPFLLAYIKDFALLFILFFPVIFSLGLLPQMNTFFMYLLEQIDIHMFGGNATTSLSSAFYCVVRSCLAVLFLLGFAYGGLTEKSDSQHIIYSIFCALTVAFSYHLSRSAANPSVLWQLMKKHLWPDELLRQNNSSSDSETTDEETKDPLPEKLRFTVTNRLMHDTIVCSLITLIICGVHSSTVFTVLLQGKFPDLLISVWIIACILGLLNHYIIPQLRIQQPWMCIARPVCMSHEFAQFEVYNAATVMWFEKIYLWLCVLEKNIVYPVLFLCALTNDANIILEKHPFAGTLMIVIAGLKCLRSVYSQAQFQFLILAFTILFFNWDLKELSESFLIDYFFMSIIFSKMYDFLLKLKFIVTYIAPWQITWGSAFHAFAQPFSVPHSAMLFIQAAISAVLSTPLNPVLGSAIFITSYVRPIKFWERDYNTKRMDQSNTRLSSLLEQNPGADDNNLNSIFYEHLTRSLQHSLCGDLIMGRWGPVTQGDCFVLASDNLNCLVHIIEIGNGLVTFQVRGLEFRGTYCQQREVEAISEGVEEDGGCCCCEPGHLPNLLSANAAFNQRWLAWEVTATKYVLEGYSISDNSATSMFQMFELRKILITYYVKSLIFYIAQSPKLEGWLDNTEILSALEPLKERKFADLDPTFHLKIDEDFDYKESGITRNSFCNVYHGWICFCIMKRPDKPDNVSTSCDSALVSLCLALSLLGRRALGPSSQCDNVEVFLQFLHSLFKGDIRPTCVRDEWVFADMELLRKIVAPAVRMSLKLHQDHFLLPDEYDNHETLYNAILEHQNNLVICHEGDPAWRSAILAGRPYLLSLRHVNDDGEDKFKIIMLNKRHLLFRVIKINRECVRGLWAGQQQELVYLRNRNPERGSIQNAKQALRNIINSSCDQPIGYPIYVSPLTTSYADTHQQLGAVIGKTLTPALIKESAINFCNRLRQRCVEGCSSGSSGMNDECVRIPDGFQPNPQLHQVLSGMPLGAHLSQDGSPIGGLSLMGGPGSLTLGGSSLSGHSFSRGALQGNRGSIMSTVSSNMVGQMNKQSSSTLASLAGLLDRPGEMEDVSISSKEWRELNQFSHRRSSPLGRDIYSKEKGSSVHNSRDSIPYSTHRDGSLVWEPIVASVDHVGEKRSRTSSRGSSVSGITFLSREIVSSGPLDPEWEMESSESRKLKTGSVHSLHSTGPSSMPICTQPQNLGAGSPYNSVSKMTPSPYSSLTHSPVAHSTTSSVTASLCANSPICATSHSSNSYCGGATLHSPIPHCTTPHCSSLHPPHCSTGFYCTSHCASPNSFTQADSQSHPHSKSQCKQQNVWLQQEKKKSHSRRVKIIDANQIYDTLNLGRRIDVEWPDEWMRSRGGRSFWGHWVPVEGMEGSVVHTWIPYHPDPKLRSHVDKTIVLLQIDDKFVPVAKSAVLDLVDEN